LTKRLNIRIDDDTYERLQAVKRATFKATDSELVRTLVDASWTALKVGGALRAADTLASKAAKTTGGTNGRKSTKRETTKRRARTTVRGKQRAR
jgi:predicted CopG family antitoxin